MTRPLTRVLLVDPEVPERGGLVADLEDRGFAVRIVREGASAEVQVRLWRPHVVLLELVLPDEDGLSWFTRCRGLLGHAPVIVITRHATVRRAVEALGEGIATLLEKPVDLPVLLGHLHRALARRAALLDEAGRAEVEPGVETFGRLVSRSQGMRDAFRLARAAAPTDANVLIVGENGTGKELMASALHDHSRRAGHPFIRLNCAAIPGDLLESELFGHRRGAFTGASVDKKGLLEVAQGGTVLFDEIAEMPTALQVKLLRVLQEREFRPVGSLTSLRADVRLLCATNLDPAEAVRRGQLREDLFFRLNTIVLSLPPLRDRDGDLPLLATRFIAQFSERHRRPVSSIDAAALRVLERHAWPGNVRELEHVIERAVILCAGTDIRVEDLPDTVRHPLASAFHTSMPIGQSLDEIERLAIVQTLERTRGNKRAAAALLGIHRPTLYNKLRKYGLWRADPISPSAEE
ncbi:acetoacetate metabolism regulatory protein AtoC [Luteitalea sp. TBR-22]|uniref:sigma-54-dependent transcriptional regulator n=1 Tax=Luteitalea sp. TBR-22 TaxID=2802971 RepID=UPI001AF41A44|nr:sigma-54 dependent transcriptional regulator [Luteitalea sp. TBR-22]BCS33657.1 acetoacetate metabolism regulatory protein AtoC [Luteitalea sp. TBR-22]